MARSRDSIQPCCGHSSGAGRPRCLWRFLPQFLIASTSVMTYTLHDTCGNPRRAWTTCLIRVHLPQRVRSRSSTHTFSLVGRCYRSVAWRGVLSQARSLMSTARGALRIGLLSLQALFSLCSDPLSGGGRGAIRAGAEGGAPLHQLACLQVCFEELLSVVKVHMLYL